MSNQEPIYSPFEDEGQVYECWYYPTFSFEELPEHPIHQIYAIALDENDQAVLVKYRSGRYGLPGGRLDPGESFEEALHRELSEEIDAKITEWQPLGYQVVTNPDGSKDTQLRTFAKIEKSEFTGDAADTVIENVRVPLGKVNEYLQYGSTGDKMVDQVQEILDERS